MKADTHIPFRMWPAGEADKITAYPFSLLLGLSLLVHLLVLAGWSFSSVKQIERALPVADFAIHLQQSKSRTESVKPRPVSVSKPPALPEPVIPMRTQAVNTPEPKPIVHRQTAMATATDIAKTGKENIKTDSPPSTPAHHQTNADKPTPANNHHRVISQLRHKLKQYFYYPRLAQRKNIQGTVVIGFAIDLRGTLTNIRVIKSSGFAILDMAAEDALLKLDHLDDNQYGQTDNLELPVIYKLTEG